MANNQCRLSQLKMLYSFIFRMTDPPWGVSAVWHLGDINVAEPKALIGFGDASY